MLGVWEGDVLDDSVFVGISAAAFDAVTEGKSVLEGEDKGAAPRELELERERDRAREPLSKPLGVWEGNALDERASVNVELTVVVAKSVAAGRDCVVDEEGEASEPRELEVELDV